MLVATAKLRIHRKVHLTRPRPQPKRNCPTWKPASTPPSNNASPTLKKYSLKRKPPLKIQPSPPTRLVFSPRMPNSKRHKRRWMNFLLDGQSWKPSLTDIYLVDWLVANHFATVQHPVNASIRPDHPAFMVIRRILFQRRSQRN